QSHSTGGTTPGASEYVAPMGVDPDFRFSNVGFDLMLDVEEQAKRRGARRIWGLVAHGDARAERMYAYLGQRRASPPSDKYSFFAMYKDLDE
ncbi:MAG: GNAT family N-acetyltransferase, partial [Planctomycetes bacterium]|nr:GNAT family N-acetyltransferase [Planctomycetota bacterium]